MTNTTSNLLPPKPTKPNKNLISAFISTNQSAQHRIALFERIQRRQSEALNSLEGEIKISIKTTDRADPLIITGQRGKTSPFEAAEKAADALTKKAVISKVNGELFDLHRPLENDCSVELFGFDSPEGRHVFWHSSAHALGECIEMLFEGKLTIGPALEHCFYYDADLGAKKITQEDYGKIEETLKAVATDKQPFQRVVLTKNEALEMFKHNAFKVQLINENIAADAVCTAYRCGPLIDLCRGPHIPSTGLIKAFKVIKHSACYWKGDSANPQMQRIYGLSFPNKKQLKIRLKEIALSKERDHRKIGKDQSLFFFHQLSPGSAFWLPAGAKIYNKLLAYLRGLYRERNYDEVISPNIYNMELWETSGHAAKYKTNMFNFNLEKQEFALKPMNCPGHCLMFKHRLVSYRELPMRLADFGVLHRNELTGALSGLSRVRRFQQDDAHIFCAVGHIEAEIAGCLDFMKEVYGVFGFSFSLTLSTRPKEFIGELEVWEEAEKSLKRSLDDFGENWAINEGDGAFYGPKIDVLLKDALGRSIQCATIQLDFNLPSQNRFDLTFSNSKGEAERVVIIHRAILGSVERFIAILSEHCGGKWPFWISPRQVAILPVSEKFLGFGEDLRDELFKLGYDAALDESNNKLQKKIREAQLSQFNVILVVGQKEQSEGVFTVRYRGSKKFDSKSKEELLALLAEMRGSKVNDAFLLFGAFSRHSFFLSLKQSLSEFNRFNGFIALDNFNGVNAI